MSDRIVSLSETQSTPRHPHHLHVGIDHRRVGRDRLQIGDEHLRTDPITSLSPTSASTRHPDGLIGVDEGENIAFDDQTIVVALENVTFGDQTIVGGLENIAFDGQTIVVALENIAFDGQTIVVALENIAFDDQTIVVALENIAFDVRAIDADENNLPPFEANVVSLVANRLSGEPIERLAERSVKSTGVR